MKLQIKIFQNRKCCMLFLRTSPKLFDTEMPFFNIMTNNNMYGNRSSQNVYFRGSESLH